MRKRYIVMRRERGTGKRTLIAGLVGGRSPTVLAGPGLYRYMLQTKSCERALPNQLLEYKHAIVKYNAYNNQIPKDDWVDLNFNQILTSRQTTWKSNSYKVGNDKLISRLATLNGKITLSDLNLSLNNFKCKYKKLFLSPWSNIDPLSYMKRKYKRCSPWKCRNSKF